MGFDCSPATVQLYCSRPALCPAHWHGPTDSIRVLCILHDFTSISRGGGVLVVWWMACSTVD